MAINASDVKKLRDATGAGMMDCKKALTQADGDFAKAEKILKEMGLAAVAKRQDRATENGRTFVAVKGNKAVLLSLSCETDFVASNAEFAKLGNNLCQVILEKGYTEINDELKGMVNDLIAVIKENMNLVKFAVYDIPENGYASTYVHGEGAVSVLVVLTAENPEAFKEADVEEFAHDLALHVAAYKPQFLNAQVVPEDYKEEQLSIFRAQVAQDEKLASKPEKVKEGIINGKLSKLYKEVCFVEQAFVKDDTKSVKQALADVAKAHGTKMDVVSYCFYQAGVNG
ncbi:MAG: translation elongation factor Ts [Candidatus Ornithospirochaeta sp.]|nr:translation elongation factor Ts [Candidatus Ornithospirochaeta sp.]